MNRKSGQIDCVTQGENGILIVADIRNRVEVFDVSDRRKSM
ncbi:MAG: hypothetical protein Q4B75_08130 [Eubacteriales bacterium]|nr:hypothetical protein [Eubacteriales bacterium]